jgi:tRNA/rRNA methyltransferase
MSFWVYMLLCADGSYYTGHTDDLDKRVGQHRLGLLPGYTQRRRPLRRVYSQAFPSREEALVCEMQIKQWSRVKKEALIAGDWTALSAAAKKRFLPG